MNPASMLLAVLLTSALPAQSDTTARALLDRASVESARGDEAAALTDLRAALQAARTADAPAEEAAAAVGILKITRATGDLALAQPLVARALAAAEGGTAEEAEALRLLAAVDVAGGDRAGAEALLRQAAEVIEHVHGQVDERLALPLSDLGLLLVGNGRLLEAEAQAVGAGHPGLVRPVQMLADCYRLRGRFPEAATVYERALSLAGSAYGVKSAPAMASLSGLAAVEEQAGHRERAEALHRDAVAIAEDVADVRDPARIEALVELARFYQGQGRTGSAEHLYVKALAASEHVGASDS